MEQKRPDGWRGRYEFQALDENVHHIRLLRVLRIDPFGTVHIALLGTKLSDAERVGYTAISYTWGSADAAERYVAVHEHDSGEYRGTIKVRENCYNVLQTMTEHQQNVYLWIDSICIDQNNVTERNHQVSNMAAVYQSAQTVAAHFSKGGQGLLDKMASLQSADSTTRDTYGWKTKLLLYLSIFCGEIYWHRIWILQELCNARSVTFYAYGSSMSLVNFQALFHFMVEHNTMLYEPGRGQSSIAEVTEMLDLACSRQSRPLIELFYRFGNFDCSVPVDRVFGLLGMADAHDRAQISVDYECEPRKLFLQLLEAASNTSDVAFDVCVHNLRRLGSTLGIAAEGGLSVSQDDLHTLEREKSMTFAVRVDLMEFVRNPTNGNWERAAKLTTTEDNNNPREEERMFTVDTFLGWNESDPQTGGWDEAMTFYLTVDTPMSVINGTKVFQDEARVTLKPRQTFQEVLRRGSKTQLPQHRARMTLTFMDLVHIVLTNLGRFDRSLQSMPGGRLVDGHMSFSLDYEEYMKPFRKAVGDLRVPIRLELID